MQRSSQYWLIKGWKINHHQCAQRQVENFTSKCQLRQEIYQFQKDVLLFLIENQFVEESIRGKESL